MHDMIVKANNVFKTCVGCIYLIPETVANNGSACTNCSRAYTDQYTPTISTTSTYIASTGSGEDDDKQYKKLEVTPNSIKFNCKGCKNFGKWEDEIELGLSSPCTNCARRTPDNFEPDDGYIPESCETCAHKNDLRVCMHCSRRNFDQYKNIH